MQIMHVKEYDLHKDMFRVSISSRNQKDEFEIPAELMPALIGHCEEPEWYVKKNFTIHESKAA